MDPLLVIAGTQVVGIVILLRSIIEHRRTGHGTTRPAARARMATWSRTRPRTRPRIPPRGRRVIAATITGAFIAPLGGFVLATSAYAEPRGSGTDPGTGKDEAPESQFAPEAPSPSGWEGGGGDLGDPSSFHRLDESTEEEWSGGGGDFADFDGFDHLTSPESAIGEDFTVPKSQAAGDRGRPRGRFPSDDMPDDRGARDRIEHDLENAPTTEEKHDVVERARDGEYDPPDDS